MKRYEFFGVERDDLDVLVIYFVVLAVFYHILFVDYCNGVFAGLPAGLFNRLQSVLRASARLVLGLPGRAPVMSAIRYTLHWLSYPQRVTFKLCSTTYKCRRRSHRLAFCRSTQTVRPPHVYIDVWFTGVFLIEPVVLECSSPAAS